MPLKFNNNTTKVQQIYDYIYDQIVSGKLNEGDSLPSLNALSKELSVSRDTTYKALNLLKEENIIDSMHGKNFFVSSKITRVLLILDEYSLFKVDFYHSLIKSLPSQNHVVNLFFHQYNKDLFDSLVTNAVGRYNKYVIMNLSNDYLVDSIELLDKSKLMLIDFGSFEKDDMSYAIQNFDINFYNALESIKDKLSKYNKLVFQLNKNHKHPRIAIEWFTRFCLDNQFNYEIKEDDIAFDDVQRGSFYIVIKQEDIVSLIKSARKKAYQLTEDIGILAYNDISFYEIIEDGISSMTINWRKMGELTAQFILHDTQVQEVMETEVILRNSL